MDHPLASSHQLSNSYVPGVSIKKLRFHFAQRYLLMCLGSSFFFFFFWYTWQAFMGWDLVVECLVGPTQTKRGFYHHNHYKIQTPFIVLRISNLMTFLKLIINMLMCCFRTF